MTLLSRDQLKTNLARLNGWMIDKGQLAKETTFKDFKEALAYVNKAGNIAESMNHHPDILLHQWNKVKLCINTHDEGGITEKDFEFARKVEGV